MAGAESLVLAAFSHKPRLCIHVLVETTRLPREVVLKATSALVRAGVLRRVEEAVKGEYLFQLTDEEVDVGQLGDKDHLQPMLGLTEAEARSRVLMLQNMKRRLICDWHPILNKLIADYEQGLKYIEGLRCGADDDVFKRGLE